MTKTINNAVRLGLCLMLTFLTVLGRPAQAQSTKSWTTVASAGTVNESDLDIVNLSGGGVASLVSGNDAVTGHIRFNVVATDGLLELGYPRMKVRFTDNGGNAQVKVMLYRMDLATGLPDKILELDSDDYGASVASQSQTTNLCAATGGFNFATHAYYIETQLIRSAAGGAPKLTSIQLFIQGGNTCN